MTATTREELDELRAVTRSFLERDVPSVDLRSEPESGGYPYDRDAWAALANALGLQGLVVPESFGGLGMGLREMAVVMEELGRGLYNGPFLSSAVIASTLLCHGDDANELLKALASGERIAALVSPLLPGDVATVFTSDGTAISGEATFVIGAAEADVLLVPAQTSSGIAIFAVDSDAEGVVVETLDSIDILRPVARVTLTNAAGSMMIASSVAPVALVEARIAAYVGLAAECIGASARALEMTVAYVSERVQFGRVLAGFQSVKHRCAEMLVELESAKGALYAALNADELALDARERTASLAKVTATNAFFFIADETVHLHGGIGFTWEHPAHLFYRRAKANQLLLGTQSQHRRVMFQSLLPIYQ